jgi:hypothetical protein
MKTKKQIREHFRHVVFTRDNFTCKCCDKPAVDAHHISDRNSYFFSNGGYVLQNGISLCEEHHKMAEKFHETNGEKWTDGFHPDDLYKKIKSSKELAIKYDLISLSL